MILAGIVTTGQALSELIEIGRRPRDLSPLNESAVE
jgi:hypothetical protein